MEKLWSPWRSQYIESFKIKDKKCVFCAMADEEIDKPGSLLVHKGLLTFTTMNLYPYNNGHMMIVPYKHTSDFGNLSRDENIEVMDQLQIAVKALTLVFGAEGFNIGANLGKVSGAGIDEHIHFHIVPRWNGDTNFMPVLGEVKVISQDLLDTKNKMVKAYASLI